MSNEIRFDSVHVVGAGGVGWPLTVALCRESRGARIHVWDDDTFEGGNGHWRLPKVSNRTVKKVDFLKGHVRMVWGEEPPIGHAERFTGLGVGLTERSLVVDCTDCPMAEREVWWKECQGMGAAMLRVSYDGNGIVVVARGLPIWAPTGGYELIPSLAQSFLAGGLGAAAVHRLMDGGVVEDMEVRF